MDLCRQSMSLLLNMLFRSVIAFLPRSKCLLISWLQSQSVILEPKKIKSDVVSTVSPSISHEVMGPDAKKDLHDPDNHDGMITHLEPDILECKVKWAWGSITMNKTGRWNSSWAISNPERWYCESAALNMPANCQWPQDWKRSVFIPIPKKGSAKDCSNHYTIVLI